MDETRNVQEAIETLTLYDMQILAWCAGIATIAGLFLSLRDNSYRDFLHLLSLGVVSGFLGLAACSGIAFSLGGVRGFELLLFFVAPSTGLSGEIVEKHLREILIKLFDSIYSRLFGKKNNGNGT